MTVLELERFDATRSLVELVVGRPLRLAEQTVDVFGLTRALDAAKDDVHAAIEAEKSRAVRRSTRLGGRARLEVTRPMLEPLEKLYRFGRREARAELKRLGYQLRARRFEAFSELPELDALVDRISRGLRGLEIRIDSERVQLDLGGAASDAIANALLRVPGGRSIAADVVSTALYSGMAQTFEEHADLIPCWEYSSVLDAGTCTVCAPLDGTEYHSLDALFRVLPGFGPNPGCLGGGRCRCRAVPCPPSDAATVQPPPPPPAPPIAETPPEGPTELGNLQPGDVFVYQKHRFKVLGEKGDGVEVQHVKTKAKQVAARDLLVDPPPKPKPAALVGKKAEAHLNQLQHTYAERLTKEELRDLDNYVGVSYRTINGDLRAAKELGGVTARRVANIDSAIAKATPLDEEITLWRGINSWRSAFGEGDLESLVGRVVSDDGYASTTTRQSIAFGAMGQKRTRYAAVMKIRAPRGQTGSWISGLSKKSGRADVPGLEHHLASVEGELLLPRGTRFKVVRVKRGKVPEIEVEIVP